MSQGEKSGGDFWMRPAGPDGLLRLGMEETFAETLGAPLVAMELAVEGSRIKAGDAFGFVHTALRTLDLRAPVAMRIIAVNDAVLKEPRLAAMAHDGRGWLLEIEILD